MCAPWCAESGLRAEAAIAGGTFVDANPLMTALRLVKDPAEIAAMRDVSERTIQRQWDKARIYLHRALGNGAPEVAQ